MSDSVKQAMETLTQQYYNATVTGLGLDPNMFQLYQGNGSSPGTSQEMWNIFNVVPPKTLTNYYDPSQVNLFSADYQLILTSLVVGNDSDFQNCMSDYYMQWKNYFDKNPPATFDAETITGLFNKWAMINAPGCASCVSGLTKALINPVGIANVAFSKADGIYAWNKTIDRLKSNIASGSPKTFTLESKTASSDTTHTWVGGGTSVFFDLFSFGGGGGYDKITTQATSAGVKLDVKFEKVTTFAAGPYASADPNDPILSERFPWYNSAVMSLAYQTKDNTVWNNQKPTTWEKAFGSDGFLQRLATAIVVVDGVEVSMTSEASYSKSEQTQIQASASVGFWPFFRASGSGGTTNTTTFNDDGQFTCTTKTVLGNPSILGVLQTPTKQAFSK